MLTALAGEELHAEILLGYAMQLFHETRDPAARDDPRGALDAAARRPTILPPGSDRVIRASELADQIELIKITPRTISMDDMSRMWTALQARYRTTVAYEVSVVLIERELPTRPSLPVLTRGGLADPATGRDPGVLLQPDVAETAPTLVSIEPADRQPVMRLGRELRLLGHGLDRGDARVRFAEPGAAAAWSSRRRRRRRRTACWCGCPRGRRSRPRIRWPGPAPTPAPGGSGSTPCSSA